jgi:hypothetical protein
VDLPAAAQGAVTIHTACALTHGETGFVLLATDTGVQVLHGACLWGLCLLGKRNAITVIWYRNSVPVNANTLNDDMHGADMGQAVTPHAV